MSYNQDFINAVEHSRSNNLFLGFGNPNGKVLLLGKETAFDHTSKSGSPGFIEEIQTESRSQNEINVSGWENNIQNNTMPVRDEMPTGLVNPLYSWGSQLNIANRRKKTINGLVWNGGTSNTYLKYQKLHQFLNKHVEKSNKINFQKDFFLTELNDIPTKYSYRYKELNKLRAESVARRNQLLRMDFFKSFPVTIVAAGHYPSNYGFDIEQTFDVKYVDIPKAVGEYWYNVHLSEDGKRVLIHTRQLSTDVPDDLLKAIADECSNYFDKMEITGK